MPRRRRRYVRRCVVCTLEMDDHYGMLYMDGGYIWHAFDSGERRRGRERRVNPFGYLQRRKPR